ncbi:MAG: PLP-dependent aminotransferase family protein [Caldilineae bacterium]|nr:MAG: PLP-dependent aminotransferase family protein [Caldilineae bacterium]
MTLRSTQVDRTSTVINFGIGQPDFDLLPLEIMQRAAQVRFMEGDAEFLNYGYEQGDGRFRQALAAFLSAGYGQGLDPAQLMITAGASQALDLLCTLFTQPGDTIFVEEPSYFLALRILQEDHGLRAIPLATDEQGLIPAAVEEALTRHRPKLLYTIPTFQNPTGRTLPADRRARLVELAQEYGFLLVADEVYHLLHYGAPPPPPLAAWIHTGHVLSIGSFSKILAPGLRLGWVQATPAHVRRFVGSGLVDSGGGLNPFTSNLVRVALEAGWQEEYLAELRRVYAARLQTMDAALQEHLGSHAHWTTPQGGYFFWLTFSEEVDTSALLQAALAQEVGFLPGVRCSSIGDLRNAMRLCFAHYNEDAIREGVRRLGEVLP